MQDLEQIFFPDQASFRIWLEENSDKCPGIWMVFYKKHTGTTCIEYQDALEEALCFGWIDSLIKKLDEDRFARKFTPRTNSAKWSELNRNLVIRLISEGKMTNAGLQKIGIELQSQNSDRENIAAQKKKIREMEVPDFILAEYALNEPALSHFNQLSPSCKREYVLWITQAKREETIRKRLRESVDLLKENRKLGLK